MHLLILHFSWLLPLPLSTLPIIHPARTLPVAREPFDASRERAPQHQDTLDLEVCIEDPVTDDAPYPTRSSVGATWTGPLPMRNTISVG